MEEDLWGGKDRVVVHLDPESFREAVTGNIHPGVAVHGVEADFLDRHLLAKIESDKNGCVFILRRSRIQAIVGQLLGQNGWAQGGAAIDQIAETPTRGVAEGE